MGTPSQGSTQMASTFACHLVGPWLFNNATCVAGSSLGLPLGLGGYSLPNTIITLIKHCQPTWAEVPIKAGVDPRRSRVSAAEATSQSRACSKGLWGFWNGLPTDFRFPSLCSPGTPACPPHCFSRPQHPGPTDHQSQAENPSQDHSPSQPQTRRSHGVPLLVLRLVSLEQVGEPAEACSCGI